MKLILRFLFLALSFFLTPTITKSQSIAINLSGNPSFCAGSTIDIPITLTGNFGGNNVFNLKLTRKLVGFPDSTFRVASLNGTSPLRFQLPQLYADNRTRYSVGYLFEIEANSPVVVSNSQVIRLNYLPQYNLQIPINYPYNSLNKSKDEYTNYGIGKYIIGELFEGITDYSTKFKLMDSTVIENLSYFYINPNATQTYRVARVWNSCGTGRILGENAVTVKVNPFRMKVATFVPSVICDDRKIRIKFDYDGKFNSNNQFLVDFSNETGSIINVLPTFTEDSTNVFVTIPNSYNSGTYRLRIRATSPDVATNFRIIVIKPVPNVNLSWSQPYAEPIAYNYPVSVNADVSGSVIPIMVRISGGSEHYYLNSFSGNTSSSKINVKPNAYYRVDSLVTEFCGVISNFTVSGEKSWNVRDDFSIEKLFKSDYCEGELLKFKIKSNLIFGQGNYFTLNLYDSYQILRATIPVTVLGDTLSATIPTIPRPNSGWAGFNFNISASQPQITSTNSFTSFTIRQKPSFILDNVSQNISTPSRINIVGRIQGQSPINFMINDGNSDREIELITPNVDYDRYGYISLFAPKSQNFVIKNLMNNCGNKQLNPYLNYAVNINSPYSQYVYFTNGDELNTICNGGTYSIKYDTVGVFPSNNQFIITLEVNGIVREIGRGNQSPITINIPSNLIFSNSNTLSGKFLISSTTVNLPSQDTTERIFYSKIIKNQRFKFKSSTINKKTGSEPFLFPQKKMDIIEGEDVRIFFESSIPEMNYQFKVNGKWFSVASDVNFPEIYLKPKRDTILYLQEIRNSCGVMAMKDTFEIKVKKYRINPYIAPKIVCQGDQIEVFFGIEGDTLNRPTDYKMYLDYNDGLLALPIISKKRTSYFVKIPEFPLADTYNIKILPDNYTASNFADNYFSEASIVIKRKANLKITALDGSDLIWYDGSGSGRVQIKITTLNSVFSDWSVGIETINGTEKTGTTNNNPIVSVTSLSTSFIIKNVESDCGYGLASGMVTLKRCYHDYEIPSFRGFTIEKEIFSDSYLSVFSNIGLNLLPTHSTLLSAKTYSELQPGFEVKSINTQNFTVEQKGCVVTR